MFDDTIVSLNEIAKLRAALANTTGGVGSQYKTGAVEQPISRQVLGLTNLDVTAYRVNNGSWSYMAGFNHGSGQFSVANIPFYGGGITQTQFYVRPFTVNQSNGSITVGSGNTIWTNGSGNCNSTTTWGQAGPYIFNTGNHCAPGNSGNTPITTVAFVNNNSVQGTHNTHGTFQPMHNDHGFCTWNGSTAYWTPAVYNGSSQPTVYSWSSTSNGTSLSNTVNNAYNSRTSTCRVYPVMRQSGTNGPSGSLMNYYGTSNSSNVYVLLGNTGNIVTTVNAGSVGHYPDDVPTGVGFELSNGRQLYYLSTSTVLLRDGNTITNVTNTADFVPFSPSNTPYPFSCVTPIATDTWIAATQALGVSQVVKFTINPTTYKINIVGSYPLANYVPNMRETNSAFRLGVFVTGNNNQFLVVVTNGQSNHPRAIAQVFTNPLSGVS